jgi:diadenosine tetraphosphate (Ap4A) HIT family hydrolase
MLEQQSDRRPNVGSDVVANIHYGGEYTQALVEAAVTGECIFCKPEFRAKALCEVGDASLNCGWMIFHNNYPATDRQGGHPEFQFLVVSADHRDDTQPLDGKDWALITFLVEKYKKELGIKGGCYFFRDGDPTISGRTVRHPHVHYYVPRIGEDGRPIPIDIPVG